MINQDFYDYDEVDIDVEEAIQDFENALLTFDELKNVVGWEVARTIQARVYGTAEYLFDDPEMY